MCFHERSTTTISLGMWLNLRPKPGGGKYRIFIIHIGVTDRSIPIYIYKQMALKALVLIRIPSCKE